MITLISHIVNIKIKILQYIKFYLSIKRKLFLAQIVFLYILYIKFVNDPRVATLLSFFMPSVTTHIVATVTTLRPIIPLKKIIQIKTPD